MPTMPNMPNLYKPGVDPPDGVNPTPPPYKNCKTNRPAGCGGNDRHVQDNDAISKRGHDPERGECPPNPPHTKHEDNGKDRKAGQGRKGGNDRQVRKGGNDRQVRKGGNDRHAQDNDAIAKRGHDPRVKV